MASVALALLVAQFVSAVMLYRATQDRREEVILAAAAFQIIGGAERAERRANGARGAAFLEDQRSRERPRERLRQGELSDPLAGRTFRGLPPVLRYTVTQQAPITAPLGSSETDREARLRDVLIREGVDPHIIAVDIQRAGDDPLLIEFAETRPRFRNRDGWKSRRLLIATIQREQGDPWETARVLEPQPPRSAIGVLVFQTLVTFGFLMIILFLVLRRITRPLALLTDRVGTFSRQPERAVLLKESGPSDTRRLIAAHNAMETRIAALLDEKDVMLGAIGHDLKTPLAALRVRIESVPDENQRAKMADSIEDITATLDDILSLARVGRDADTAEAVDLGALMIGIAEEFEDLGEPVTIIDPPRLVARVQVTWIKRALRNLTSNAVRYGETAELSIFADGDMAVLRVDDSGPGIAPEQIADMLEPFTRGEASRNRTTGGAGLGLTLARAIAEAHGGNLVLANRDASAGGSKGLRAEIRLPMDQV